MIYILSTKEIIKDMFKKKKEKYDSALDTIKHIRTVQNKLGIIISELYQRGIEHDASKLEDPEKEIFDVYTPKLKNTTYGSDEYKKFLDDMRPALQHHYRENRHHPEYFDHHGSTGYTGIPAIYHMNLIDVIEMFCDWAAASERHDDGSLAKSIEINKERFHLDQQLVDIFKNTVKILEKE